MKPILSLNDLAWRLGVSVARLREIADEIADDFHSHYSEFALKSETKKDQVRVIRPPSRELKEIQWRIKNRILDPIQLSDTVHGGVRGRSPRSNAEQHVGQRCVVSVDVRRFYDNVRHYAVNRMFRRELGCGWDVARLLTRLTTLRGSLPQGAPTSTAIANVLLARGVDEPISAEARRGGLRYTRFVDDITFSGSNPRPLINVVAPLLSSRRLPVWRNRGKGRKKAKLKIMPNSGAQEVTGLIVNSTTGPSVPRRYRDRVRAAIFSLRETADELSALADIRSIRGKIEHVRQFNPGAAKRLQRSLESTIAAHSAHARKTLSRDHGEVEGFSIQ